MRYATLGGGKQLRGVLVMESAALFGVDRTCRAGGGGGTEMLHAYSWCMTICRQWTTTIAPQQAPHPQGVRQATAILAGDAHCRPAPSRCWPSRHPLHPEARAELSGGAGYAAGARGCAAEQMIDMLAGTQT
jgi:farnesyl diphosphate synthase